jgi:hypothetical protein
MSARKKKEDEGGLGGELFLAVVALLIGAGLGVVFKMNQPAAQLAPGDYEEFMETGEVEAPQRAGGPAEDPDEPSMLSREGAKPIYFVFGSGGGGAGWEQKRNALTAQESGSRLRITYAELNTWVRQTFRPPQAPEEGGGGLALVPSLPNFFISEDQLHISMGVEIHMYGRVFEYRLACRGHFPENSKQFVIDEFLLGGARLPHLLGGRDTILNMLLEPFLGGGQGEGTEVAAALAAAKDIAVDDGRLVVRF